MATAGREVPAATDGPAGRRQRVARWCRHAGLLPLLRSLREVGRPDLRILAYHRVLEQIEPPGFGFDLDLVSASAEGFRRQMQHLRKHFSPMRFDEVSARMARGQRLPKRAVLVTFDDGYDDNYRVAFPILRDLGMSAMFFVSTGHIDSGEPYAFDWLVYMVCRSQAGRLQLPELGLDWVLGATLHARRAQAADLLDRLKSLDAEAQCALIAGLEERWGMRRDAGSAYCRPMTWDQLREMHAAGMEVGSHGVGHHMLAKLPRERMVAEVVDSKRTLERELGGTVQALSYPVGGLDSYSGETIEVVRRAGYPMACSYMAGTAVLDESSRHSLARIPIERQMDQAWFESMLAVPELFVYRSRPRRMAGGAM